MRHDPPDPSSMRRMGLLLDSSSGYPNLVRLQIGFSVFGVFLEMISELWGDFPKWWSDENISTG